MLIEFTVGNFKSFDEPQIFSFVASRLKSVEPRIDEENVSHPAAGLALLKSAAVYGSNGSGKSNLIKALSFLKGFVINSSKDTQASDEIKVDQFRLTSRKRQRPSLFQIVFLLKGKQYRYGFEVDSKKVVSEWLFFLSSSRESKLFERTTKSILPSRAFREGRGLEDKTRSNALFLSVCAQFNGQISTSILSWFKQLNILSGLNDIGLQQYTINCVQSQEKKADVLRLIQNLDFRIKDLLVEEESPVTESNIPTKFPKNLREALLLSGLSKPSTLKTIRAKEGGTGFEVFSLNEDESEGTKKLISLAGPLIDTLKNGKVFVIDELDARLHPLITKEIIKLFNSAETNPKGAQLLFTTHDTNLLSNKLFRRDQIWFAELDQIGSTKLYSLVEYRVPIRNDASFEKDYIQGRYGAIPFIGNLEEAFQSK